MKKTFKYIYENGIIEDFYYLSSFICVQQGDNNALMEVLDKYLIKNL
jgi:hypothetical protein